MKVSAKLGKSSRNLEKTALLIGIKFQQEKKTVIVSNCLGPTFKTQIVNHFLILVSLVSLQEVLAW